MVTYSDWIQPPNFTRTVTGYGAFNTENIRNLYAYAEREVDQGAYSQLADPNLVTQVLSDATSVDRMLMQDTLPDFWDFNHGIGSTVAVKYSAPMGGVDKVTSAPIPPYIENEWAAVNLGAFVFSAYDVNGWLLPPKPADAIAAEIEGQPTGTYAVRADITQAILEGTAYHNNVDRSLDGETHEAVVSWTTTWMAGGGTFNGSQLTIYDGITDRIGPVLFDLIGKPHGTTETYSVDVTEQVTPMGELVLTSDVSCGGIDLADYHVNGEATFGTALSAPQITYTFHPPRYRWIYDTAPQSRIGYNRIVQRGSDGYGMTGGLRVLGGTSRQASNRRGAAFR